MTTPPSQDKELATGAAMNQTAMNQTGREPGCAEKASAQNMSGEQVVGEGAPPLSPVAAANVGEQLSMQFATKTSFAEEDFILHDGNRAAFTYLAEWPDGTYPFTLLVGPPQSGKSHLASLWANRVSAHLCQAFEIADIETHLPLLTTAPICVEQVDDPGILTDQSLFHFLNTARAHGQSVLMTARQPLAQWPRTLPDLLSRMKTATPLMLAEADEAAFRQLLVKLLADRNLIIEPQVLDYIAVRMIRSYAAVGMLVAELDRHSLVRQQAINRTVAGLALDRVGALLSEERCGSSENM